MTAGRDREMQRAYEMGGVLVVPWRVETTGQLIELQTPDEFAALPDGTVLTSIFGERKTKGTDDIDLDTRFGRIAWGVPDRREASDDQPRLP